MLATVCSFGLGGIEGFAVRVEVNLAPGLPAFEVVGLPGAAVRESRERVRAALKNGGFGFPTERITVNLAPADLKKEGPAFDLPIALGLMAAKGLLAQNGDVGHRLHGLRPAGGHRRLCGGPQPGYYPADRRRKYTDEPTGAADDHPSSYAYKDIFDK